MLKTHNMSKFAICEACQAGAVWSPGDRQGFQSHQGTATAVFLALLHSIYEVRVDKA